MSLLEVVNFKFLLLKHEKASKSFEAAIQEIRFEP